MGIILLTILMDHIGLFADAFGRSTDVEDLV